MYIAFTLLYSNIKLSAIEEFEMEKKIEKMIEDAIHAIHFYNVNGGKGLSFVECRKIVEDAAKASGRTCDEIEKMYNERYLNN